ncbi:formylglycine-generating enzyme family protein [Caulobacter sp. 73W]|uniref:Formylglycine-generating enzyme family protein n=1 Tax=Caulobacter sp. 73W TaxID=3161137 RepID=A0AB39KZ49_9CAUL
MIRIQGGAFLMGSERNYPEEAPTRRVKVDKFWIDQGPVTNAQFAAFVADTGYRTFAELAPDPAHYPDLDPAMAIPGSAVFQPTDGPVELDDHTQWWAFTPGADWRHPAGPDSDIFDLDDHPVVQVAYADALAYAKWAGKTLPTEAEWEFAARGGLEGREFAWGDELAPDGAMLANYWQGRFPFASQKADGGYRTTSVGAFPANGYGLHDMIGNVWEWTRDWYGAPKGAPTKACCAIDNPRGAQQRESLDPDDPQRTGRKVIKGGSHLCAPNYCRRYRPAARHPQAIDSPTSHIGFRCVVRA